MCFPTNDSTALPTDNLLKGPTIRVYHTVMLVNTASRVYNMQNMQLLHTHTYIYIYIYIIHQELIVQTTRAM